MLRWSLYAWFAVAYALVFSYQSAAAAANAEGCTSPVSIVSRSTDKLDAFVVDAEGGVRTAAWQPGDSAFRGWWRVGNLEAAPCSPVSAVSRSANKMDVFTTRLDGHVYTAAWQPGDTAFRGWWRIGDLVTVPHGSVTAVSRSADKLDVFAVGLDGFVYTAAWQPGDSAFRGWWRVGNLQAPPGAEVSAISRSTDKMDIFVAGSDGRVYTAAWQPGDARFRGWWSVAGGVARPGAPVGAVSRSTDKMDVFVVGTDGQVYTAAWQPGDSAFRGWWRVGQIQVPLRASVSAVSRSANRMDVFVTANDGKIYTAAWQPGDSAFRGWWSVAGGQTRPGTAIGTVSRSNDKLDVVATGNDAHVYAAAWQPGDPAFRGWWAVADVTTGMTDPRVDQWSNAGTVLWAENTSYAEEAQGFTNDGNAWYLVSNGSKTIRKLNANGSLIKQVSIPQGVAGAHVGAPGYYDRWIYVPLQGPRGIWKISADMARTEWHPINTSNGFSWAGVNPLNGRLYTTAFDIYQGQTAVLWAYDRLTLERRPEDDIPLEKGPVYLDRIQGGTFTNRGRVILVRSDPNAVFCFSALTGHYFGAQYLAGGDGSEVESVTVRPWFLGSTFAPVHILDLDNDLGGDDYYLRSFSVPHPERL